MESNLLFFLRKIKFSLLPLNEVAGYRICLLHRTPPPTQYQVFLLEQIFGDTYRMRKKEVEQDREDYLNNEVVTKAFVIGNHYQHIGQRQVGLRMQSIHRWDLFVRMEDDSENVSYGCDRLRHHNSARGKQVADIFFYNDNCNSDHLPPLSRS